jgi:cadmium resistance protein CadD (predicted permease)
MINPIAYIIGASIVGILHMAAPDHWLTLCVFARNKQWAPKKLFGVSLVTAVGHVALSVGMGLVVVVVGLVFSHLISSYLDIGIGAIMVVVGLTIGIRPFIVKHPHHHEHDHHDRKEQKSTNKLTHGVGYFAVLGAALSPDLSIVPIFLSAIPAGFYFAIELAVVFAISSIITLLLLVKLGTVGLAKTLAKIPEKYNDSMAGFVIAAIGIFILVSR